MGRPGWDGVHRLPVYAGPPPSKIRVLASSGDPCRSTVLMIPGFSPQIQLGSTGDVLLAYRAYLNWNLSENLSDGQLRV